MIRASKEQQDAVDFDGNVIVVANPGTGKTTTLSLRVIKLLGDGVRPEDILCITFTNKAKKAMFDAIYDAGSDIFPHAELMKVNIHTFHSLAYDYLVDAGMMQHSVAGPDMMRFSILNSIEENRMFNYEKEYLITDLVPRLENELRHIKSLGITPGEIDIAGSSAALASSYGSHGAYSPDELGALLPYFVRMYKEYESGKDSMDYADMLLAFGKEFQQVRFEHVLVDEMQDMNEMEADIVRMTARNLFLVGDPKQAIFGFQGGSVKNFEGFNDTCELKLLSENRRSSRQILDYSKEYFLANTGNPDAAKRELEAFTSQSSGAIPRVVSTDSLLPRILDVIESNPGKTVGVITRTNRQLGQISEFLDARGRAYSSTSLDHKGRHARDEIRRFIRGLLSSDVKHKVLAAFTAFSPYSLQEAFEFSRAYRSGDGQGLAGIKSWGIGMGREDLDSMFAKTILPVCVSRGLEWFIAAVSAKDAIDRYLELGAPELGGLLDFVAVSEESGMEHNAESNVTLTTVHKSKGKEFDVVVYVPNPPTKTDLADRLVDSILAASGMDGYRAELKEELLRADFVALTRAREQLIIVGKDANVRNYSIGGLSEFERDDSVDGGAGPESDSALLEAYSLFVAGRDLDARKVLDRRDDWLAQHIRDYFKGIDRLSYSGISANPYDFLTRNIIGMPYGGADTGFGLEFGLQVHDAMRHVLRGGADVKSYDGRLRLAVQNALDAVDSLRARHPGLALVSVENRHSVSLDSMTDYEGAPMTFTGVLDAVFVHGDRHLIVDYKTDKRVAKSKHRMQLAAYRRMLSVSMGVPEDKIDTCLVFPALRGGINTDELAWEVVAGTSGAYPKFEANLQKVLGWKNDPEGFIDELLESKSDTQLFSAVRDALAGRDR